MIEQFRSFVWVFGSRKFASSYNNNNNNKDDDQNDDNDDIHDALTRGPPKPGPALPAYRFLYFSSQLLASFRSSTS